MSTSKTGKHGHAKVHLVAIDIFTGKKLEDLCPSTHNMDVPNVSRTEYQLSYIDDEFLNLIRPDGSEKSDVKVPDGELGVKIKEYEEAGTDIRTSTYAFHQAIALANWPCQSVVTIIAAMGEEAAISVKEAPKS